MVTGEFITGFCYLRKLLVPVYLTFSIGLTC